MTLKKSKYIWFNGQFILWDELKIPIASHSLHYGVSFFEGIRAYATDQGSAIFRAPEHFDRLNNSLKLYGLSSKYTCDEWIEITKQLIRKNNLSDCYIRPLCYLGDSNLTLSIEGIEMEYVMIACQFGTLFGEDSIERGVRCKISSWLRNDGRITRNLAKCSTNYANSILAKKEALECGYDEAILLNSHGNVCEGSGQNLMIARDGVLYTPPVSDHILEGLTLDSVITIARDLNYKVIQTHSTRDMLSLADEAFFMGTASEIAPIQCVGNCIIGDGKRGPITKHLQDTFFQIVNGKNPEYSQWLTLINS